MKIALCQTNPIIGHFEHNTALLRSRVVEARARGCSLVVFPELSLIGYPPRDLLEKPAFVRESLNALERFAREIRGIHVLCGFVEPGRSRNRLINGAALLGEGRVLERGGKRLLPTYDVFDEARYFEPAPQSLRFEMKGLRVGVTVCEDIWNVGDIAGIPMPLYDVHPVDDLACRGMDLLVNISASPYTQGKPALRSDILKRLSARYETPIVYCNQTGGNDDLLFDGSSMVADRRGRLVHAAPEFEETVLYWDTEEDATPVSGPWLDRVESVLKGLVMGTRDYTRKCGFRQVLVGLSGGVDSALVAVIAAKALGPESVIGVSMPSGFTSDMSREDARRLALNLGIRFEEIPIQDVFHRFKEVLAPVFQGMEEDETEENIQARIRGTLLMALSNKLGALLLSTGNKSELAMGYCTLYGDMSGGLAVISDVPKTLCYRIARLINREEPLIPERIITRPPSAELRPNQTDQDTLPPYEILDRILEDAVEGTLSQEEISARGFDPAVVADVFRRLNLNEYKRRQAPPGLKVTSKAFGYGRRYPIARGGMDY
ncbi:MAG: NAD+ synthase [Deltaproteobacteria bacterium]|nr:NAD+ synthase [Deltaproteobacteria bacterium]